MPTLRHIIAIVLAACVFGQADASGINRTEIDKRIEHLMQRPEMAGMAVAIVENGEIVFAKGYGVTQKGGRHGVSENTVFRWASLSKGVAATAVLQLSESGDMELQTPIDRLAPSLSLPEARHDVTVEDVLSHRTGLTNNAYDRRIEDGRAAKHVRADLGTVERICEPGACHSYQNVAFDAVAEAIESVTRLPYKTVVAKNIFQPLGMNTASITLEGLEQSVDWAKPHNSRGNPIYKVKPTYYRLPAAAGVNSSVLDLAKWMQGQMDGSALSPYVRESMHTPRIATPYEDRKMRRYYGALKNAKYGLGWRIYDYGENTVIGHRGAVEGYRAQILFDPERKTGIAVLWNSNHYRPAGLALEVMDQVYDNPKRDWMRLGPKQPLMPLRPGMSGSGGP